MSHPYQPTIERALGVNEHRNNVRNHFYCVKEIFELHNTKEKLEALLAQPDVDTVCAADHFKMKDHALNKGGLSYQEFNWEHFRGIKVPQFEP